MSNWIGNDDKLPQGRLDIFAYVAVGMILLLLVGFWKLQVVQSTRYNELADRNRIRAMQIIAPRGKMLDREGRVIVDNYPSFSILLLREDPKLVERSLPVVSEGLGIPIEELEQDLEASKAQPKFQPVIIKPEASEADIAFVESHRPDLPVLELLMVHRRRYPRGGFMANAIGYVGEVSERQIDESNGKYRPGDIVGKSGLEREYNETLQGTDGMRRMIVNSIGRPVKTLDNVEAVAGKPIELTIDYDLQQVAETGMAGKEGAVVAMDPRTGEILAILSHPTFDPNDFAIRIPPEEWASLNSDQDTPLLNRAIQAQLAPGSVFKIVLATAMLETKEIPENFTVYCPGYAYFYGRMFKCHVFGKNAGHGEVDFHKGIVQSCDIFFYNVGKRLGIDTISHYASLLGLGRRTGIDLPSEEPGLVPSEEWTERVFHRKWFPGETISVAVGQGAVTTTPVQLARMIGGVASEGLLVQPHMLMNFPNPRTEHFPISQDSVAKITDAMYGVVNEGGTAAGARLEDIEFCGKSGSAQVIGYDIRNKLGKQRQFKDNAWFVGYAPRRNPEIVVAVLVQGGEHGGAVAGPIARDIVKAYYDKKMGHTQEQATAENMSPGQNVRPVATTIPTAVQHAPAAGAPRQ